MKRFATDIFLVLLLMAVACACSSCSDHLDIKKEYAFSVETLPLPKSLKKGESVDLEFSVLREGHYSGATYKFRYFQSSGEGNLTDSVGEVIPMNRFRSITADNFVLHYTSQCEDQQQLDFVFEDNFGQKMEYTLSFANKQ
ncbi:MAG: TraQ conjugal transfer family protein [Bacteroidota bacterium]|nr:TraQ conjugal transfer family protein [Bacteroidota bacterium]MDP4268511.1 TraQ conjugal transfer family protein [Bacteroidota bacterium]